jgi:hypothetical protein
MVMPNRSTHEIGIPHPDRAPQRNLAHQQTVHPAEGKLDKLHILRLQMGIKRGIYTVNQLLEFDDLSLDSGLGERVVVLNRERTFSPVSKSK